MPINLSIDDIDKFEEKEITKKRTFEKNTSYDFLTNFIFEKTVGCVKDKVMSLFKTNTTKDYSKLTRVKNVYGGGKKSRKPKIQNQSEDKMMKNMRNLFRLKMENEAIKNRMIGDINTLFEQEEGYSKPVRVAMFVATIISNIEIMVIETKPYQSKNTLKKLNHP